MVSVVDDDEFDAVLAGRQLQALENFGGKRAYRSLGGIADSVLLWPPHVYREPIAGHIGLLNKAAEVECVQEPETPTLVESGTRDDVSQSKNLSGRGERFKNVRSVDHGLDHV